MNDEEINSLDFSLVAFDDTSNASHRARAFPRFVIDEVDSFSRISHAERKKLQSSQIRMLLGGAMVVVLAIFLARGLSEGPAAIANTSGTTPTSTGVPISADTFNAIEKNIERLEAELKGVKSTNTELDTLRTEIDRLKAEITSLKNVSEHTLEELKYMKDDIATKKLNKHK